MKTLHIFRTAFILTVLFALSGLVVFSPLASAANNQSPPQVYINDKYLSDVNPITVNGHLMVPLNKILESVNAVVSWDGSLNKLFVSSPKTTVTFTIGSYNVEVNGKITSLNEPVQIIEGRTFAPLSFIVETFDCEMYWDEHRQMIHIYHASGQQQKQAAATSTTTTAQQGATHPVSAPVTEQTQLQNGASAPTSKQPEPKNTVTPPVIEQSVPVMAVSVTAADLHIRSGPSTSSDVIGMVPGDTVLAYTGEEDGWYQVNYQGQLGWVASWHVTSPSNAIIPVSSKKMTLLPVPSDPEAFVRQMKPFAETASKGTGLPVNFLLAQWAEECGYGTSSLAQYYNNFGGIKNPATGGFRQYSTPEEFAQDVIRIYTEHSQYAKLLADARAGASLKTLFNDLSRCGYATAKNYGEKIRAQYLPTIDEALENIK